MKNLLFRVALVFSCLFCFSKVAFSQVDLYLDSINVYVDEYGSIGIYTLPDTIQQISRLSPLVGTGPGAVFDYQNDMDVEDSTTLLSHPAFGDYEIYGSYNNNFSGLPPTVLVK